MDERDLLISALQEADGLGPEPDDVLARWTWDEEWRGAVELLAELGEHDAGALSRAALQLVGVPGHAPGVARSLLLEAAARARGGESDRELPR